MVEVTQIKGDGETHPFLSPDDEFADYESWDLAQLRRACRRPSDMLEYEYARSALKVGLRALRRARREPLPLRHDRLDRFPHGARDRGRGQLLRQAQRGAWSPRRTSAPSSPVGKFGRHRRSWAGSRPPRAMPPSGRRRTPVRRSSTRWPARGLRDHRAAHHAALLRRLGLRATTTRSAADPRGRLREGRADGRRSLGEEAPARQRAEPSWSRPSATRSARTSIASRS